MKSIAAILSFSLVSGMAGSALAADYYETSRYWSADDVGQVALFVEGSTVRTGTDGTRIAEVTSVNALGITVSVYTANVDCNTLGWRITYQTEFRYDQSTAPHNRATTDAPFVVLAADAPNRKTLDFICAWPVSVAGAPKIVVANAIALSDKIAPGLGYNESPREATPAGPPR